MSTPRFLVSGSLRTGTRISLTPAASHHALRVLRLREGAQILVFDGAGHEALATLEGDLTQGGVVHATLLDVRTIDREAATSIAVLQALCAQDKIDWLVEKCVELGAARIVLFPAERSVVRLEESRRARREERLREIAIAASAQCGRTRIPSVAIVSSMREAFAPVPGQAPPAVQRWILDPGGDAGFGADALDCRDATFAVGPEGGFTNDELSLAHSHGFTSLRLGPRVLRTETAGLAAVAALLALRGEFT
jgi:16S rRNA (uracil1498-N3)-methyltransferase